MEKLISESLSHSQNVHKAIKKFQGESNASNNSRIVNRIINYQLALIKNEYLIVYHEHSVFVEKYEEKLKKILKREAFISKEIEIIYVNCELCELMLCYAILLANVNFQCHTRYQLTKVRTCCRQHTIRRCLWGM